MKSANSPQRIVCLTGETTETLHLLGEDERIVGISGFTSRPKEARLKAKVSAFTSAKCDRILELRPHLVIGFSNLHAQVAHDLIQAGVNVLITNQRSVEEIFDCILLLARVAGAEGAGAALVDQTRGALEPVAESARGCARRPRVFFEEWMGPRISGIRWVEKLMELACREPVFVIIASRCGRKVVNEQIRSREGWASTDAVRDGHIYEVQSAYLLQPGPAALTEGVRQLHAILARVVQSEPARGLKPQEELDPALCVKGDRR
ncbi:MAG: transporter, periplasmic ligand binding protein [Candidatus Solibacter sp.]|nr:transporter, periplasmic ligand binding protein [Candidatus Solibacter sp.]